MEFLNVRQDEAEEVEDKLDLKYWQAHDYERRLELALTEKERAEAVNQIAAEFRKRLQNVRRTEISQ